MSLPGPPPGAPAPPAVAPGRIDRWRRSLRLMMVRGGRRARRVGRLWRGSLQVRVIASTLAIGLVALMALGAYLSVRIRDGLFTARVDQVLEESARSTSQAQDTFDSSTATTAPEVQLLLNDTAQALRRGGSGEREIIILRAPRQTQALVNPSATDPSAANLISPALRAVTAEGEGQHWESVAWPVADGSTTRQVPGIMVGQLVSVPAVGSFELYFLYSAQPEQEQLEFLQRMLGLGGAVLVALLGSMTWLVTRQVVQPVRRAAQVAERIADGSLAERMEVRGEDEMATLGRSFNEMTASLQDQILRMEELSTLQRRFVSDVSHELRTPLTTIRMAGEVLYAASDDFPPPLRRSAELLQTQLDRFEDLLAELLEISRFDAGAAVLDAERRDVRDVVLAAVDQAVPLAARRSTWLQVQVPDTSCTADIDPRRVERILRNLLVNAIEHAEGTTVEVTVAADSQAVAVSVRDHGVGMSIDEAAHVFDRFWRADPARARTTGGTGLGLAISREDAHLHAGWLEAWGRPGQGAAFRLTVPRRAGIRLQSSPLPLAPPPERPAARATPEPRPGVDPSALPELGASGADVDPADGPSRPAARRTQETR